MLKELYLIHELAEKVGTTVRTIRYYTIEGLLPEPEFQGKFAYYNRGHLNRLELIKRMKAAYLPLKEIREILSTLSDDEVRERLKETTQPKREVSQLLTPSSKIAENNMNATEYIAKLISEQEHLKKEGTQSLINPLSPQRHYSPISEKPSFDKYSNRISQLSEKWRRVQLAPGVELHLQEPIDPAIERQVEQLLLQVRKLFAKYIWGGKNEK